MRGQNQVVLLLAFRRSLSLVLVHRTTRASSRLWLEPIDRQRITFFGSRVVTQNTAMFSYFNDTEGYLLLRTIHRRIVALHAALDGRA